ALDAAGFYPHSERTSERPDPAVRGAVEDGRSDPPLHGGRGGGHRGHRVHGEPAGREHRGPAAVHGHGAAAGGRVLRRADDGRAGAGHRRRVRAGAPGRGGEGRGPLSLYLVRTASVMAIPELIQRAEGLIEALPYIRAFQGKTLVIKYGGAAMEQADLKEQFAKDVLLLRLVGIRPVIVHGGGPQIGSLMKRLGKEPRFVGGMRVTDEETVQIVEMVLVGKINKEIVGRINHHGGRAIGLSGKDAGLIKARRRPHRMPNGEEVDIGLVGEVETVNTEALRLLTDDGFIPVIAPVGVGAKGETYNINADLVAGDIAAALGAEKLIHLTDVQGILDSERKLVSTLTRKDAERLVKDGVIDGGMLPKVESSLRALEGGIAKAHTREGRQPHAILLELFTREGIGTEIVL